MSGCLRCGAGRVAELVDCGPQPITNRFIAVPDGDEYRHALAIGQCGVCGLVQLTRMPPAAELAPRVDWITYNEPEAHLENLASRLAGLEGLSKDSLFCGVSFKDDTILRRMRARGFANGWRIDPMKDLGVERAGTGVETVQNRLTFEKAEALAARYGRADVVIARHIYEHACDLKGFVEALKRLAKPEAYFVFEVPDCAASMERLDYCMIWEEHLVYFTSESFRGTLSEAGFCPVYFKSVSYPMENSLIGIVRLGAGASGERGALAGELRRGRAYTEGFVRQRKAFRSYLEEFRKKEGGIAVFGAGHLACAFINYFELAGVIEFVVDDHPRKKGLYMPGSKLPILGSAALTGRDVKLCLLGLNPDSEDRVVEKNRTFVEGGGRFESIFPASSRAIKVSV